MTATPLRVRADGLAGALPALVLSAERLAAMVAPGAHGLRRGGPGEEFWQYRPATATDGARSIDWRRSARGETRFVRDREAQSAQSLAIWAAGGASMAWSGAPDRPDKRDRARLLALALGMVALRGGERVGLWGGDPPRAGRAQGERLAQALLTAEAEAPDPAALRPQRRAVLIGDFLTDPVPITSLIARAGAMGVRGLALQVLDPDEAAFPYRGAVLFRAPDGGPARFDTRAAQGLRDAYLDRLAERRALIGDACARSGWRFGTHETGAAPSVALAWLHNGLSG